MIYVLMLRSSVSCYHRGSTVDKMSAMCVLNQWVFIRWVTPDKKLWHQAWRPVLKDKYPNFEVGLKCVLKVNPYLLVCSYIK